MSANYQTDMSPESLALDLIYRGLLPKRALVDGDLMVVTEQSRHLIHVLITKNFESYLVKKSQKWQPHSSETLQKEAKIYSFIFDNSADLKSLANLTPRYFGFDPVKQMLIIEFIKDAENLKAFHERVKLFPSKVGRMLGESLSAYHHSAEVSSINLSKLQLPRLAPWVFSLHKQMTSPYGLSGANAQLFSVLARYGALANAFDTLREEWAQTAGNTLIHADMKWENCLLYPRDADHSESKLKIIDWEMADIGDPLWDAGAVFSSYITAWVLSIQSMTPAVDTDFDVSANFPISGMQPALREFWDAYSSKLATADRKSALLRSIRYAAARMVQTTFEHNVRAPSLSANLVLGLQAAMNMLEAPEGAISALFGEV